MYIERIITEGVFLCIWRKLYPLHLCFVLYKSHAQKQLHLPHYFHTRGKSDYTYTSDAALVRYVTHRSIRLYSMFSGH